MCLEVRGVGTDTRSQLVIAPSSVEKECLRCMIRCIMVVMASYSPPTFSMDILLRLGLVLSHEALRHCQLRTLVSSSYN